MGLKWQNRLEYTTVLVPAFQMIAKLFHEIGNATVAVVQMYPSKKCLIPFVTETSCELCGFNFENRKALASHARAHLRQLGIIEWKADGARSPIELLSELIRKDPVKVAAITRRYQMGDLYIKKVRIDGKHSWCQNGTFLYTVCTVTLQLQRPERLSCVNPQV